MGPVHNSSPATVSYAPEDVLDVPRVIHWSGHLSKHRISAHSCRHWFSAVVNGTLGSIISRVLESRLSELIVTLILEKWGS